MVKKQFLSLASSKEGEIDVLVVLDSISTGWKTKKDGADIYIYENVFNIDKKNLFCFAFVFVLFLFLNLKS